MKSFVLLLALLQSLGCSGIPVYNAELESMADRGLGAALAQVNSAYTASNLYRAIRGSVKRVIPMGMNTVDLLMMFDIKKTECMKASAADPQTCAFTSGFFVPTFSCSSRVRMLATSTQVVSLRCGIAGSSSSESSEEAFSRGSHQFNIPLINRAPAPSTPPPPPPPPVQPGHSLHGETAEDRTRGDTFNNFLE